MPHCLFVRGPGGKVWTLLLVIIGDSLYRLGMCGVQEKAEFNSDGQDLERSIGAVYI